MAEAVDAALSDAELVAGCTGAPEAWNALRLLPSAPAGRVQAAPELPRARVERDALVEHLRRRFVT